MKAYALYIPIVSTIVFTAVWLGRGHQEMDSLRAAIAQQREALAPRKKSSIRATPAPPNEATTLRANNASLLAELGRIEQETSALQAEAAALQARIPPSLKSEVTESLGRVADMGAELGQFYRLMSGNTQETQQKRHKQPKSGSSPDVMQSFQKFVSWASEVGAMEDTPAEIASLQSAALREFFSLDPNQARKAESIIREHFAVMKANGLTFAGRESLDWRQRRSASLTQLLWKLRPFVPSDSKHAHILPQIINLGAGIETTPMAVEPGSSKTRAMVEFPRWPAVPWLPAKSGE